MATEGFHQMFRLGFKQSTCYINTIMEISGIREMGTVLTWQLLYSASMNIQKSAITQL